MKKLICLVCIGGLGLATIALGENKNHGNGGSVGVRARGNAPAARSVAPATSRHAMSPANGTFHFKGASSPANLCVNTACAQQCHRA